MQIDWAYSPNLPSSIVVFFQRAVNERGVKSAVQTGENFCEMQAGKKKTLRRERRRGIDRWGQLRGAGGGPVRTRFSAVVTRLSSEVANSG